MLGVGSRRRFENDTFPYRSLFARPPAEQFDALTRLDYAKTTQDAAGRVMLIAESGSWDEVDGLADNYNESVRVRSRLLRAQTPIERWTDFERKPSSEKDLLISSITREPPDCVVDPHMWKLRELIGGPECTQFRPSVAKAFYSLCSNRWLGGITSMSILDPCAGYGDRFLGAIASGIIKDITLVDPNPQVHAGYRLMASELKPPDVNVRMLCAPFELVTVEPERYDVVFTSPPFFDKETYWAPGSTRQAENFPGPLGRDRWKKHWMRNWYLPFVRKAARSVRIGGIIALYVSDTTSGNLEANTIAELNELKFERLDEVLVGRNRTLPIICFRRSKQ